jgi:hypothetical protein
MDEWAYYMNVYQGHPRHKKNNSAAIAILIILIIVIIIIFIFFLIRRNSMNIIDSPTSNDCIDIDLLLHNANGTIANKAAANRAAANGAMANKFITNNAAANSAALQKQQYDNYNIMKNNNQDKIYYSDQLDPLVVGQLYENTSDRRPIYTQRTAYGQPVWETEEISKYGKVGYYAPRGLHEYNSSYYYQDVGASPYVWKDGQSTNQNYEELMSSLESYDANLYNNLSKEEYDINQKRENINNILNSIKSADDGIPQNWNLPSTPILNYNINNNLNTDDYYGTEGATPYTGSGIRTMFTPDHSPLMG